MSKTNPTPGLADRLIRELTACRAEGGDSYPVRLDRLAARLEPPPEPAAVLKAVGSKAFTVRAVVAVKGRTDAPAALLEDLPRLAASPLTLEAALRAKGHTKTAPPWAPKGLAVAVHQKLKPGFLKVVGEWVEKGELPPFAVALTKGKAAALHHRDNPPPPPPAAQDAGRLVDLLRRRTRPGEPAPLLSLAELREIAGLKPAAFNKAVKEPAFADLVAQVAYKPTRKQSHVFVMPRDELGRVASGGPLLLRLLEDRTRSVGGHAFPVSELVAGLGEPLKAAVTSFLYRDELARELPPGVGFVLVKPARGDVRRYFFRLEDVQAPRAAPQPPARPAPGTAPQTPPDFAAAFDAAFVRIDRERGSNNFVSLVDLRAALPGVPREAFDAGLRQLRRDRRYVLTSDERYDGLTPEQQAAAIREEGEFLLHVSRGRP